MKRQNGHYALTSVLWFFLITQCACQSIIVKSDKITGDILARSAQWGDAFAQGDMPKVMELFSPDAQLATAGGKWKDKNEGLMRFSSLIIKRPDLKWMLHPKEIVVNQAWEVAYETGQWTEWWTEPDGRAKIEGTYFLMWKKKAPDPWLIHAAIFTPLSCTGESQYCQPHDKK